MAHTTAVPLPSLAAERRRRDKIITIVLLCGFGAILVNLGFWMRFTSTGTVNKESKVLRPPGGEEEQTPAVVHGKGTAVSASTSICPPTVAGHVRGDDPEAEIGNHPAAGEGASTQTQKRRSQEEGEGVGDGRKADEEFVLSEEEESLSATVFRGVRTFEGKCLYPDTERLTVYPKEKALEKVKTRRKQNKLTGAGEVGGGIEVVSIPGDSFMLRDVCALGHFPKDLTHYHTWVEDELDLLTSDEKKKLMNAFAEDGEDGVNKNGAKRQKAPPVPVTAVRYVVLGHRCVTKDLSKMTNKRTPVYRDVMRHWVDAVVGRPVLNDSAQSPSTILESEADLLQSSSETGLLRLQQRKGDGTAATTTGTFFDVLKRRRFFIFYEDIVKLLDDVDELPGKKSHLLCFDRIREREEAWRWFPSQKAAHSFRHRLWHHFDLLPESEKLRNELLNVPFEKQRKLQILVLRRDEDRHFNEEKAAKFLKDKFGVVANIVFTQFDKPPPNKLKQSNDIDVPSFQEQIKALFFTDVLVAAHGAALSSVVVMRPGTVVLELFPHNFRYYMYEELAIVLGLRYVPVEGSTVSPAKCCRGRGVLKSGGGGGAEATTDGSQAQGKEKELHLRTAGELSGSAVPLPAMGLKSIRELNGLRDCKKCDIAVSSFQWYYLIKNALSSVWLRNSRLSNVHHFDVRR